MAKLQDQVAQIGDRIVVARQELIDVEKEANAFEESARAARRKMPELKAEIVTLGKVLGNKQVAIRIESDESAAAAARQSADAALKRLAEKEKQLDALIAKHETQEEPGD